MGLITISDVLCAIAGLISVVGSIAVYVKMSHGKVGNSEEQVRDIVLSTVGLCLALIVVSTLIR